MAPTLRRDGKAGGQKVQPVTSLESEEVVDDFPEPRPERHRKPAGKDSDIRTVDRTCCTLDPNLKIKPHRWDLDTTLELLDSMKAYIIKHEVHLIGVNRDRWAEIALSVENTHGMEPDDFARSCRTRFESVKRYLNRTAIRAVNENIRRSMEEYARLRHRYAEIERIRLEARREVINVLQIGYVISDAAFQASQTKGQGSGIGKRTPTSKWRRRAKTVLASSTWSKLPAGATELRSTGEKSLQSRLWRRRACTGVSYERFVRDTSVSFHSEGVSGSEQ